MVAAPALRRSPQDHAAGLAWCEGNRPRPPLAKSVRGKVGRRHRRGWSTPTRFRGSSRGTPPGRGFQWCLSHSASPGGGSVSRWRRWARSTEGKSVRLTEAATSDTATARFRLLRPGRSVPTREAARRRGGFEGNNVLKNDI